MSRRKRQDEPTLFDLPLADEPPTAAEPAPASGPRWDPLPDETQDRGESDAAGLGEAPVEAAADPMPLFSDPPAPAAPTASAPSGPSGPASSQATAPADPADEVPLPARLMAGFADLAVHLAVAVSLLFGSRLLGVRIGLAELPALALFLLVFSFLYTVIPLAFWGRTPGMGWAGLTARGADGDMLTFSETARRWAGGVATALLLAFPLVLVVGGGPSLADRWSGTRSVWTGGS